MGKELLDGAIGLTGILSATAAAQELQGIAAIVCSIAIAIATCIVQVYRIWRDRDKDKTRKNKKKEGK